MKGWLEALLGRKANGRRKEGCGMGRVKFSEWLRQESMKDETLAPCLPANLAVDFLCNYLLGEDWYCVMPMHAEQVNAEIVQEILMKYSRKYRKEYKRAIRRLVG